MDLILIFSNDLLDVIATYTVPSVTYPLVTLAADLAGRLAYSQRGFWRRKVEVEREGLIFDDGVVQAHGGNYHTYYRIINRREFGTAAVLWSNGKLSEPLSTDATRLRIGYGWLFVRTSRGSAIFDINPRERSIKRKEDSIFGVSRSTKEVFKAYKYLVLDDSGRFIEAGVGELLGNIADGVVEVMIDNGFPFLRRDGTTGHALPGLSPAYGWSGIVALSAPGDGYTRNGDAVIPPTGPIFLAPRISLDGQVSLPGRSSWTRLPVPAVRVWKVGKVVRILGVDGKVYVYDRPTEEYRIASLPLIKLADLTNSVGDTAVSVIY